MRVWTRRQAYKLQREAASACRAIEELLQGAAVRRNGDALWGQFVDGPRAVQQYGIYGTSAAVQVLALTGGGASERLVGQGIASFGNPPASLGQFDKDDLENTFKVAFILDAMNPDKGKMVADLGPLEARVLSEMVPNGGWGNYLGEQVPQLLPSLHILQGLASSRKFTSSLECDQTLRWVCEKIYEDRELPAYVVALGFLILSQYAPADRDLRKRHTECVNDARNRTCTWAANTRARDPGMASQYHYARQRDHGSGENRYMFHMPELLVARAILEGSDIPIAGRQFAIDVVAGVCANVRSNHGFRSPGANRMATVDQLEAVRLLQAYSRACAQNVSRLLPPLLSWIDGSTIGRFITSAVLLIIGAGGLYLTFGKEGSVLKTAGAVMSAVCLGILATAIWSWMGGDKRDADS